MRQGNDYNPDDLPLLEPIEVEQPPKKRKTETAGRPPQTKRKNDVTDEWEGDWDSEQEDDGDESDEYKPQSQKPKSKKTTDAGSLETSASKRSGAKKAVQSKRDTKSTKSKGIVKRNEKQAKSAAKSSGVEDPVVEVDSAVETQVAKQKKPRRDKKDKAVDLTQTGDSDENFDESKQPVVMTPLSSIWTAKAPVKSPGDTPVLAFKQDFVWDSSVFCDNDPSAAGWMSAGKNSEPVGLASTTDNPVAGSRERALGKRQGRSVHQSQIRQNLMSGNLDPHTMVQCESYMLATDHENQNSRSRGAPSLLPPFKVIVHPDATFVCDLHSHLATCEIIGFLGGKWDEETKTLYIQAAFPCRSLMIDGDDGSTDVEMDPGSEIELRGIINDAELEVVGWYHSHPAFAPDPSIRDIENQASYQQLFKRTQGSSKSGKAETSEPFVGLIVGTYDTRRDTPVSLFRYFHVRGEKVSGGARREIFMPYEFIPERRHYRQVVNDMANHKTKGLPIYPAVLKTLELPQAFRSAPSLTPPSLNEDDSESQAIILSKSSPARKKASATVRKRKQSADIGAVEAPAKRGKRIRKKKNDDPAVTEEIDLTMEDDNEATIQDVAAANSTVEIIDVTRNEDDDVEIRSTDGYISKVIETGDANLSTSIAVQVSAARTRSTQVDKSSHSKLIAETAAGNISASAANGVSAKDGAKKAGENAAAKDENVPINLSKTGASTSSDKPANTKNGSSLPVTNQIPHQGTDKTKTEAVAASVSLKPSVIVETGITSGHTARSSPSSSVTSNGSGGRRRNRKPSVTNKYKSRTDRSPQSEAKSNSFDNTASSLNGFLTNASSQTSSTRSEATPPAEPEVKKPKDEKDDSVREFANLEYFVFGETDAKVAVNNSPIDSSDALVVVSAEATITSTMPVTTDGCSTDEDIEIFAVDESKQWVGEIVPSSQGSGLSDVTPAAATTDGHSGGDAPEVPQCDSEVSTTNDISRIVSERLGELVQDVAERIADKLEGETEAIKEPTLGHDSLSPVAVLVDENPGEFAIEQESIKSEDVPQVASSVESSLGEQAMDVLKPEAETTETASSLECQTDDALEVKHESLPQAQLDNSTPVPASKIMKTEDVHTEQTNTETIGTGASSDSKIDDKLAPKIVLKPLLFGRNQECEDIRTSLEMMGQFKLATPKIFADERPVRRKSARNLAIEAKAETSDQLVVEGNDDQRPEEQLEGYLTALRSRYGDGMFGCVEQVITLVDYYRDFERRINLLEPWKAKMNKLRKIEASLSEYVQYLNLSVDLRRAFIGDLVGYLELSWALARSKR